MIKLKKRKSGNYWIKESEYEKVVEICRNIYNNVNSQEYLDPRMRFVQSDRFPTVEDLQTHDYKGNFQTYFPYLVYYQDVYESDDPEFKKSVQYIADILYDMVEIVED